MATTFKLFYLGTGPTIDTFEGNTISENHNALNGLSFGGPGSPIANNFSTLTPDGFWSYTGGATNTSFDADNLFSSEGFSIDGGSVRFFDTNMTYTATTIAYTDGTSVQIDAIIMQDSAGRLYLLPPTSAGSYADALEAKPIQSVTLGTAAPSGGNGTYGMMADRYVLTAHDYLVEGSSGSDLINASFAADPDNDKIDATDNLAGNNNDSVLASGGNDTVYAGLGDDTVLGEAGDDILLGQGGNDTLDGGFGNDILAGGEGADFLVGSTGLDIADYSDSDAGVSVDISGSFIATGGHATGDMGTGIDGIFGSAFNDTLTGSDASDTMPGDIYTTVIDGGAGNDSIDGRGGDDSLYGGVGADTILGGTGADLIYGDGISSMFTPSAHASLSAGAAKVFNFTNGTTSTLKIYWIDTAGQLIDYGLVAAGVTYSQPTFEGHNWVAYDNATNQPVMYLGSPADGASVTYADGDDSIEGGLGNDSLAGDGGDDFVDGSDGNDSIDGGSGNDLLSGGDGEDTILGGDGDDTLSGGAGSNILVGGGDQDVFFIASGPGSNVVQGGETGTDFDTLIVEYGSVVTYNGIDPEAGTVALASGGTVTFTEIERIAFSGVVEGTASSEVMNPGYFDAQSDQVDGADGVEDTILGYGGDDTISAGAGNDLVLGGEGNDALYGWSGADSLLGGDDADILYGGAGDTIDGGEGGVDSDTLDLTGAVLPGGSLRVDYDGLNPEDGTVYFRDASGSIVDTLAFQNIEIVVPCFTADTRIKTPRGEVPAAEIKVGDLVLTRDSGMQVVRWVGKRRLTASELRAVPHLAPVIIEKGALGCDLPERDMTLSPQHRVLMSSAKTQLYFGEDEVFVAAANLLCMPGVRQSSAEDVVYIHIMFDRHEVICGDGAWSESFQPGDSSVRGFDGAQRAELAELFPQLTMFGGKRGYPAARPTLKEHEAQLLAG
jgi:Ca2+-binding RTX toxin-like protein